MRLLFFIGSMLLTLIVRSQPCAIPGPISTCTSIESNGDVTLTWVKPSDPNNVFVRYELNATESITPLKIISDIDSNFITINKLFAKNHFYISVVSLCSNSLAYTYGDTVQSFSMSFSNPLNGTAEMNWNNPNIHFNGDYVIQRKHPTLGWQARDTLPFSTSFYRDTVDVCNDSLYYRVEIPMNGCSSYSTVFGDKLKDITAPLMPRILSASYDTIQDGIILTWKKPREQDIKGYIIYLAYDGGSLFTLDSTETQSMQIPTSYLLKNAGSSTKTTFSIAAYDYCASTTPPNNQTSAKADVLHSPFTLSHTYNVCSKKVRISWTQYQGWDEIVKYRIFYKKEKESWKVLDSTVNLQFYETNLEAFNNYQFCVQAESDKGVTAFSSRVKFYTVSPSVPAYHYTRNVTVSDKKIRIEHLVENITGVKQLALYRERKDSTLELLEIKDLKDSLMVFTDSLARVQESPYSYVVQLIDSCGNYTSYANTSTSMLVTTELMESGERINRVRWTPYSGYSGSIIGYNLYRGINGVYEGKELQSFSASTFYYEDDLTSQNDLHGKVCYYIEAIESTNKFGQAMVSRSNTACPVFDPAVFVPNAFTPGGVNPIFKPVSSLIDPLNYTFSVSNRWGQLIFYTHDVNEGWDGSFGNEALSPGLYIYHVTYRDGNDKEITTRGLVSLIR